MCSQERLAYYKRSFWAVLCQKNDWATLLHLSYYCYLALATNYIAMKLLITNNFSAYRKYLVENCLPFPFAPRWVRHSYSSKGLRLIPYTCGSSNTWNKMHADRKKVGNALFVWSKKGQTASEKVWQLC